MKNIFKVHIKYNFIEFITFILSSCILILSIFIYIFNKVYLFKLPLFIVALVTICIFSLLYEKIIVRFRTNFYYQYITICLCLIFEFIVAILINFFKIDINVNELGIIIYIFILIMGFQFLWQALKPFKSSNSNNKGC